MQRDNPRHDRWAMIYGCVLWILLTVVFFVVLWLVLNAPTGG